MNGLNGTHHATRAILEHICSLPPRRRGWIVYPLEPPAYIDDVTVLMDELIEKLEPSSDALIEHLLLALGAVLRHPACEPGFLGPARIGYAPVPDSSYLCFLDEARDILFLTMHGLWHSVAERCLYAPLIMSPLPLIGESHMLASKILRSQNTDYDSPFR